MAKDYLGISLLDIMPDSIRGDPQVQAAAKAIDDELARVAADIRENLLISRIDELPENVLDLLAWQWHVDFYQPVGLDIEKKRKLIRQSIAWHRIKGTPAAVEKLVTDVFGDAEVVEWYQYGGAPYYFRVLVGGNPYINPQTMSLFLSAIDTAKNKRSWLDNIILDTTPNKYERENQLIHSLGMASVKMGRNTPVLGEIQDAEAHIGVALGMNGRGTKTALGGVSLIPIEQNIGIGFDVIRLGRQTVPIEERDVPGGLRDILATGYTRLKFGEICFRRRGVQRVDRSIDAGRLVCRPQILLAKGGTRLVPGGDSIPPWHVSIHRGILPIKMGRRIVSADMSDAPQNAVSRRSAFAGVAMAGVCHAG